MCLNDVVAGALRTADPVQLNGPQPITGEGGPQECPEHVLFCEFVACNAQDYTLKIDENCRVERAPFSGQQVNHHIVTAVELLFQHDVGEKQEVCDFRQWTSV